MSEQERTRVAIIGAGVVGLTLAVAINAFDKDHRITIDLYEAAPELGEIGAGINVWPKTWEIFKNLGLEEVLVPFFDHEPDLEPRLIFQIRKADQKNGFKVHDAMNNGGALRIHRADLQQGFIKHLPLPGSKASVINTPCTLHLSHRLVDYTDNEESSPSAGPITLHFADQPSATCDILIGADGIKSHIRRLFLTRLPDAPKYKKYIENKWSGLVAYRGLVPREELQKVFPGHRALVTSGLTYSGRKKYLTVYPVSGGKSINVVAIVREAPNGAVWEGPPSWRVDVSQKELLDLHVGWDEEVVALLQCIKQPSKWALHYLDHLDLFARGRVFLTGDAAHSMLPHLGAGATVGIEDAYILATLFTYPSTLPPNSKEHIEHILNIYNTIRVPRAVTMSRNSTEDGDLCSLETPEFDPYREGDDIPMELLLKAARGAEKNFSWTTTDPNEDRQRAIQLLLEQEKTI